MIHELEIESSEYILVDWLIALKFLPDGMHMMAFLFSLHYNLQDRYERLDGAGGW